MAFRDLLPKRRLVDIAGRRYTVRRPTVHAVHTAVSLFGQEITAIDRSQVGQVSAIVRVLEKRHDPRLSELLQTFVDSDELAERWPAAELIEAALSMCDVDRIVDSFQPDETSGGVEGVADDPGPSKQEIATVRLAERFGCSPLEVLEWPCEAFLCVCEVLANQPEPTEPDSLESGKVDAKTLSALGLGYNKVN